MILITNNKLHYVNYRGYFMVKVDYNLENMLKCICCKCQVQTQSSCAREKTKIIQKVEARGLEAIPIFEPEEFPWLYCAVGRAKCRDLNFEKQCVCKDCKVWKENNLSIADTLEYYCKNGNAK
jgi:Protein of unknown function (DUF2769)